MWGSPRGGCRGSRPLSWRARYVLEGTPIYLGAYHEARCSEQTRRKTVTQSHGATADVRHACRAASDRHGSTLAARTCFAPWRRRVNFTHEPALRLACLIFAVAAASSCELPIAQPGADQPAAQLVVAPKTVTLSPDQLQDFTAVGLTASRDTAVAAGTGWARGGNGASSSS